MEEDMKTDKKNKGTRVLWVKQPPHMGAGMAFKYMGAPMGKYVVGKPVYVPNDVAVHLRNMVNDEEFDCGEWEIGGPAPSRSKSTVHKKESDA